MDFANTRATVRLTDNRYTRDLLRYRLAIRLLQLQARTRTIERWTGLSMYRIRTLRAYAADLPEQRGNHPLRGVSPHQPGYFFRSAALRTEAAVLAGFLQVFGVVPAERIDNADRALPGLTRGIRLCRAYEQFRSCAPDTQITIEYAILLLTEIARGVELTVSTCRSCDALILVDELAVAEPLCSLCQHEQHAGLPHTVAIAEETETDELEEESQETDEDDIQGDLF
jgi:hypothetical protein